MSVIEFTEEQLSSGVIPVAPATPFDDEPMSLARSIAYRYGVDVAVVLAPSGGKGVRQGSVPKARHALMRALRERGWSYPQIGQFVGGRDHSTVMAAVRKTP